MAANAAEMEYAVNGTYGSAAYDLNRLPQYAEPREIEYELPDELTNAATEAAVAVKPVAIPVLSVLGIGIAAVLMVFVLLSYVKLAEIATDVQTARTTITQLETEEAKLRVKYESTFNLNEVERYATKVLGMTKLTEANTKVITMERTDKAEILNKDDSTGVGFISAAKEYINSLTEYFG